MISPEDALEQLASELYVQEYPRGAPWSVLHESQREDYRQRIRDAMPTSLIVIAAVVAEDTNTAKKRGAARWN